MQPSKAKKYGLQSLNHWVHKYLDSGGEGRMPKGHLDNSIAALGTSKIFKPCSI